MRVNTLVTLVSEKGLTVTMYLTELCYNFGINNGANQVCVDVMDTYQPVSFM